MALIGGHWDEDEDYEGNFMPTSLGSELREEREEREKKRKKAKDKEYDGIIPIGFRHDD